MPAFSTIQALGQLMENGVLMCRGDGRPLHANEAALALVPRQYDVLQALLDLIPVDGLQAARNDGRWNGMITLDDGRILRLSAYFHADAGDAGYFLIMFHDVSDAHVRQQELQRRHAQLRQTLIRLAGTQEQLVQSEKMASIGQLAAGVAHEINNPIGYVHSNLGSLQEYLHSLFALIEMYERALRAADPKQMLPEIDEMRARYDIDFITGDLPQLMAESREGIERVTQIVRSLKDFSHTDRDDAWKRADLHHGLDSTINIIWNELKYKVALEKHYGKLPMIECMPSELNQVFMNILLNAGQSIQERGTIEVRTGTDVEADEVWVEIEDSGSGIPEDILQNIFDPFFTTKAVGSGTGLGLSISYGIIKKHQGRIDVTSVPGQGSCFRISLPIKQLPREDG
ncbi:ATP-binding protein [Pseudoxanthomonas dokdonensis]|uniref:histidine kinase n=1 Tax=Pseudoxanthomonas dokdonensis TaxID=344882 RepID=A0A0R0CLW6_9GAMM|nr:ATP-binding protein [Pseudoxanthomonas dokdonensis]KRG71020.1 histidine kinase [Pseudoxanthomonas dokdonensis]